MKNFNIIKKAFSAIAPKSAVLPILECVLVMDNQLMITDLNTSVIIKDVGIPVNFVQDGKGFIKVCGFIENPNFDKTNEKLTISGADESFTFYCEEVDNFPKIEYKDTTPIGKISSKDIAKIQRAVTVISRDELRPAMMHVAIKDGFIMGTDAHSAIFEKSDFAHSTPVLLGKKTIKLLSLFPKSDWNIAISGTKIVLENKDIIIVQRVDDNRFPDLLAVVPKELPIGLTVNKKEFEAAVNKALICSPSTLYSVILDVNSRLTVSSENVMYNRSYKRQLSCGHSGDNVKVALNGRMLMNLTSSIKTEELSFGIINADRAVVINGSSLLMPVKQNQ